MRKLSMLPLAALLLGAGGAMLRRVELNTAFDPANGLPARHSGVATALIVLACATAALSLAVALIVRARYEVSDNFRRAYYTGSYFSFAVRMLLSVTLLAMAAVCAVRNVELLTLAGISRWIFIAFMALSGLGMAVMAYYSYTQRAETTLLRLGSVMPALFFCYWMVALYRVNAGNPVLLDYGYGCLALGGAAMSFYYAAGYAYRRKSPVGTVFVSLVTVFLLTVTLADSRPVELNLVLAATAVYLADETARLLSGLVPKLPAGPGGAEDKSA